MYINLTLTILTEKRENKKKENKKQKRHSEVTQSRNKLLRLEKQVESAISRIMQQQKPLYACDGPLMRKTNDLKELRSKIAIIKGTEPHEKVEDGDFHIDGSRDSRGHTFLMIAAQNQDFATAKLCFELQADPNVTNSEGFMAIEYSHFFSFESITDLILQVCD